ncbi:hypothetical protein LXL04_006959 [Taraxacum kok-saghyz]
MNTKTTICGHRPSYFTGCMSPSVVPVHEEYAHINSSRSGSGDDWWSRKWRKLVNKLVEESKKSIYGSSKPVIYSYDAVSYLKNFDKGKR